jgi:hypothetical protein
VEVSLELPSLGVPGGDGPCARGAELVGRRCEVGLQPAVLEREEHRPSSGAHELGILVEAVVVDDEGDDLAAPFDCGHRAARWNR